MNEKKNKPDAAALRDAKRGHKARIGYARIVLVCLLGALLAATLRQALPFLLCFAAGAMLWVILTEMVPESQASSARVPAAWWTILGFCLMTILDVALG